MGSFRRMMVHIRISSPPSRQMHDRRDPIIERNWHINKVGPRYLAMRKRIQLIRVKRTMIHANYDIQDHNNYDILLTANLLEWNAKPGLNSSDSLGRMHMRTTSLDPSTAEREVFLRLGKSG